jgi:glycosyltransferase involved in cell wall biosynthesis
MRILLTVHQFFPQFAAGTEVLVDSVARALMKRGHVVHVLAGYPDSEKREDSDRFSEYDFKGIHVYRFHHAYVPMGGQISKVEIGYDNRLAADYFDRILESFRPNLVHFFHLNRLGTGLIDRAVHAKIPRFMTPTDFWTICPTSQLLLGDGSLCSGPTAHSGNCVKHFVQSTQGRLIGKIAEALPDAGADLLVRLTNNSVFPAYLKQKEVSAIAKRLPVNVSRLNQLNGIIVPNKFMKKFLVRYGVKPDLIAESAFGVDVTSVEESDCRSMHAGPLRIGFIGTLSFHKGCHILVEAFKLLPARGATLKIYGCSEEDQDYATSLQVRAGENEPIEFCGTFPNSEIAKVFSGIDVLVVPSLWYENTPLVIYSAQAARCPVVASDLPGLSAVIKNEENGLLFESGCSVDLEKQLARLVTEEGLLQRLSANSCTPKSTELYVDELLAVWNSA